MKLRTEAEQSELGYRGINSKTRYRRKKEFNSVSTDEEWSKIGTEERSAPGSEMGTKVERSELL